MSAPSVFILDDDASVCRILNRMLSLEEYEVQTSQSVQQATTVIAEKPFDAYVLDYRLRDGTGLDVAEQLRSKGSSAPIILMSGYDLSEIVTRAETLHVSDLIQKPFTRDVLCDALKKSIGPEPAANGSIPGPGNTNGAKVKFAEPVAPRTSSTNIFRIAAIVLLVIVVVAIIYMLATRH